MRYRNFGGEVWLRHPLRGKVVGSNPMDSKKSNHVKGWCGPGWVTTNSIMILRDEQTNNHVVLVDVKNE